MWPQAKENEQIWPGTKIDNCTQNDLYKKELNLYIASRCSDLTF